MPAPLSTCCRANSTIASEKKLFDYAGLRLGLNASTLGGDAPDGQDISIRKTIQLAAFAAIQLNHQFVIQPEIHLSSVGATREYLSPVPGGSLQLSEGAKITYIEVPVLLKFPLPLKPRFTPSVFFGPKFSLRSGAAVDGSYTAVGGTPTGDGDFNKNLSNTRAIDVGIVVGYDAIIGGGKTRYVIDVRYNYSITSPFRDVLDWRDGVTDDYPYIDLTTGSALNLKNRGFSITFGICKFL